MPSRRRKYRRYRWADPVVAIYSAHWHRQDIAAEVVRTVRHGR